MLIASEAVIKTLMPYDIFQLAFYHPLASVMVTSVFMIFTCTRRCIMRFVLLLSMTFPVGSDASYEVRVIL